ncbi:MAG: methyltransferase domain-containing protein [Betaproteobacteria bacterium]|jgi:SAM-dependent methyltransferase
MQSSPERACNICGESAVRFLSFGDAAKAIRCPNCLSFERHRRFKDAYDRFIRHEFDFRGKDVLACVPGKAELEYFFVGAKRVVSFDVRPVNWFDLQMDITDMSQIPDASVDVFVAIAVLQHVERHELVPPEVHRVLRPGGRCLIQATNHRGPTTPYPNLHAHYTEEEFEKYRVGTFRVYRDLDLISMFTNGFVSKTFYGEDPVCGGIDFILSAEKVGV